MTCVHREYIVLQLGHGRNNCYIFSGNGYIYIFDKVMSEKDKCLRERERGHYVCLAYSQTRHPVSASTLSGPILNISNIW